MINRHFSLYSTFVHAGSGTVLVLNPKVMTTFTRDALRRGTVRRLGWPDPSSGVRALLPAVRRFPMPTPSEALSLLLAPQRFEAFAFVRNPYSRCVSAWRNKLLHGHRLSPDGRDAAYPPSIRGGGLAAIRRFARDRGLPGGAPGTLVPFDSFVRFVSAGVAGRRDAHWDLQLKVIQADHFRFARIYRMEEELEEGFVQVFGRIGLPEAWTRRQLRRSVNANTHHDPEAAAGFDVETAALFRSAFQEDFEAFGYDPEDWSAWAAPGVSTSPSTPAAFAPGRLRRA